MRVYIMPNRSIYCCNPLQPAMRLPINVLWEEYRYEQRRGYESSQHESRRFNYVLIKKINDTRNEVLQENE